MSSKSKSKDKDKEKDKKDKDKDHKKDKDKDKEKDKDHKKDKDKDKDKKSSKKEKESSSGKSKSSRNLVSKDDDDSSDSDDGKKSSSKKEKESSSSKSKSSRALVSKDDNSSDSDSDASPPKKESSRSREASPTTQKSTSAAAKPKAASGPTVKAKSRICLMFDDDAEDAVTFYVETFPNSEIGEVHRNLRGLVLSMEFNLMGIPCVGLNGGEGYVHSESFSFQVTTDSQEETDKYWKALVTDGGGTEAQCGWCKDKWGISWQIIPDALTQALGDPDPKKSQRAYQAMMQMKKIEMDKIEKASRKGG